MASRTVYTIIIALTVFVSYLITSIRFYSRSCSKNGFRWNLSDTIIIMSLVLQTFTTGIGLTAMYLPVGEDPQTGGKLFVAGTLLYYSTLWSIKVSISVFLIRLTKQLDRAALLAKCSFYLICATFVVVFVANMCQCLPMSRVWEGACDIRTMIAIFWTNVGLNISTDIMLIIVPFPVLLLITERRTRIAISIVFGLAGIVVIVSVVRAILLSQRCGMEITVVLSHIEIATGVIISALPEVSRSFTRLYLQGLNTGENSRGTPTSRRQPQGTKSGGILSRDAKEERFANRGLESSQDRINDIEGGSANERPDSSSESVVESHIGRISWTNETQGKEETIGAAF